MLEPAREFPRRESRRASKEAGEVALVAESELGGQVRKLLVSLGTLLPKGMFRPLLGRVGGVTNRVGGNRE